VEVGMKKLYESLARAKSDRAHAEACRAAVSAQADKWLQETEPVSKRLAIDEGGALDKNYNAAGALSLARDRQMLRHVRDGA
jgi:hypothetical protein